MSGSGASARAIATRCRMPPESSFGLVVGETAEPDDAEQLVDPLARVVRGDMPMHSSPNATFSLTVRHG